MNKAKLAIYPGSFDPITHGHVDIIRRALNLFEKVIIAVGDNPAKKPLFSIEERVGMINESTKGMNVEIEAFDGLLADFAKRKNCNVVVRSLRAVSDFDYEFQMAIMNRELDGGLETVFLMTDKEYFYLSSGLAKEIAARKGKLSSLVPRHAEEKLREKFENVKLSFRHSAKIKRKA